MGPRKDIDFPFVQRFLVVKVSDDFQAFYMAEHKQEVSNIVFMRNHTCENSL